MSDAPDVTPGLAPEPPIPAADHAAPMTRAERRRALEAGAPVSGDVETDPAEVGSSRLAQRREEEARRQQAQRSRALWKAWWFYPLAAALIAAVVMAAVSSTRQPTPEPSISTITDKP